jgi:hypothetical protein
LKSLARAIFAFDRAPLWSPPATRADDSTTEAEVANLIAKLWSRKAYTRAPDCITIFACVRRSNPRRGRRARNDVVMQHSHSPG